MTLGFAPAWSTQLQDDALASIGGAPRRIDLEPSPLLRLGQSIEYADAELNTAFARVALSEMLMAYRDELEEVRIVTAGERHGRYRSWSVATQAYLERLSDFLRLLEEPTPVRVILTAPATVQLLIGGRPIIVQGPRLASPMVFERRIVEAFCLLNHCPEPPPRESLSGGRFAQPAQGIWSFSDSKGHAFETAAGLRFVFRDLSGRRQKQQLCLRLSDELNQLAAGLESTRSRGVQIDWDSLEVVSLGRGYTNRVTLNGRGDYFELELPNLGRLPMVWKQATPWLQAQVAHHASEHYFSDADSLLNPLLE